MSTPPMFGSVVPLDREAHKKLHLRTDLSTVDKVKGLNSMFLTTVEFSEACKEFPIVFVRAGEAPKDGGKQPALCVPLKDFVRYDLIEEKSPIVAPDGGEPGKIVS